MAIRIVGVDLPQNKRGEIALTYVYGIGRSSSAKILDKAGVNRDKKVVDWTDDDLDSTPSITASLVTNPCILRSNCLNPS